MTSTFEIVAEPTRRRILDDMRDSERSVGELVERLQLSQPGVSKHLRVLREAGLVEVRRDAQRRAVSRPHRAAGGDRRLAGALPAAVEREARRARPASRRGGHMNEGTIQPLDGRSLVRFERRYPHSMERVWAALTEPDQLRQWFGEGDIELGAGRGRPLRRGHHRAGRAGRRDDRVRRRRGGAGAPRHRPPGRSTAAARAHVLRRRVRRPMGAPARRRRLPAPADAYDGRRGGPGFPEGAGGLAHPARPARPGARRRARAVDAGRLEPQPRDLPREGGDDDAWTAAGAGWR